MTLVNPGGGRLELEVPGAIRKWPAGLKVGDDVIVVARGKVRSQEVDLVDVTAFQSPRVPDLTTGESKATVTLLDVDVIAGETDDPAHEPLLDFLGRQR